MSHRLWLCDSAESDLITPWVWWVFLPFSEILGTHLCGYDFSARRLVSLRKVESVSVECLIPLCDYSIALDVLVVKTFYKIFFNL